VHGPAGLISTLIHFVPLLTTPAPCGQYFFFAFCVVWKKFGRRRSGALQTPQCFRTPSFTAGGTRFVVCQPSFGGSRAPSGDAEKMRLRRPDSIEQGTARSTKHTTQIQSTLAFCRFPFNFLRPA